jgi:hypothetical protein
MSESTDENRRLLYLKPFVRILDLSDTEGKPSTYSHEYTTYTPSGMLIGPAGS